MASQSIWKYKWYDTPNDQDGMKKAFALGAKAGRLGFCLGAWDVIISDIQRTNLQKALRVGAWILPLVGMSTAFTVTQQLSLKLVPGLDQKFSFMLGGISAAGVMGHSFKSGQMAFVAALFFGGAGFAYQYAREGRELAKGTRWGEQFQFYPDDIKYVTYERHQNSHWLFNNYDWRIHQKKGRCDEVQVY